MKSWAQIGHEQDKWARFMGVYVANALRAEGYEVTRDNEQLYKPSRTTGEFGEPMDQEWKRSILKPQAPHRTMVVAITDRRFGAYCYTCKYDHTPGAIGNNKEAIQAIAREHEASHA